MFFLEELEIFLPWISAHLQVCIPKKGFAHFLSIQKVLFSTVAQNESYILTLPKKLTVIIKRTLKKSLHILHINRVGLGLLALRRLLFIMITIGYCL